MSKNKTQKKAYDQGKLYASHWTNEENINTPVNIAEIEKIRESRKKHYVEIAKE